MNFFKKLFGKGEPFVPTPVQTIPGLEPIVVYAVENLYPSMEEQKYAFTYLLKHTKENDTLAQLGLLKMGIKWLEDIMAKDPTLTINYALYQEGFPNLKAAKKWVKKITSPS